MKVLFDNTDYAVVETDKGNYSMVSKYDKEKEIPVSNWVESFIKFGGFNEAPKLSSEEQKMVEYNLKNAEWNQIN